MSYITMEEYNALHGAAIDETEFDTYAEHASEAIDAACDWAIKRAGLDTFDAFDTAQIKLACARQVEYLWYNGIENALTGSGTGGAGGYVIGQTQITAGSQAGSAAQHTGGGLCAAAAQALIPTGLLYAGIGVVDRYLPQE